MSRFINPVPQFWLDDGTVASSGRLYFYENKNYSLLKTTYSQSDNTVANTNPVKLDGQGRMPACFGDGLYSVKLYAANPDNPNIDGELQWTRDDVSLSDLTGQFELWYAAETYQLNDIVKDPSDGQYYKLYGVPTSKGEPPSTTTSSWEMIVFITKYNPDKTYEIDEIVSQAGLLYRSLEDDNNDAPPSSKWGAYTLNQTVGLYTPVSSGTTSSGVGTYTTQSGVYERVGRRISGTADVFWSAHTGTGGIDISLPVPASSSPPFTYAGGGQVINTSLLGYAAGKQLVVSIAQGSSNARILMIDGTAATAVLPMDTNCGISISFSYITD